MILGAGAAVDLRQVLGPWRQIRCRVCGGADCTGALHVFGLCNQQRPGPPEPPAPPPDPPLLAELPGQLALPLRWT